MGCDRDNLGQRRKLFGILHDKSGPPWSSQTFRRGVTHVVVEDKTETVEAIARPGQGFVDLGAAARGLGHVAVTNLRLEHDLLLGDPLSFVVDLAPDTVFIEEGTRAEVEITGSLTTLAHEFLGIGKIALGKQTVSVEVHESLSR